MFVGTYIASFRKDSSNEHPTNNPLNSKVVCSSEVVHVSEVVHGREVVLVR